MRIFVLKIGRNQKNSRILDIYEYGVKINTSVRNLVLNFIYCVLLVCLLQKAMIQWRIVNGNQSVPIEKFLEMVGNSTTLSTTSSTSSSGSSSSSTASSSSMGGVTIQQQQQNNTMGLNNTQTANASILIATANTNKQQQQQQATSQNVQINQQLAAANQQNKTTINSLPIIASIAPNTLMPQPQSVVIIVSLNILFFVSLVK